MKAFIDAASVAKELQDRLLVLQERISRFELDNPAPQTPDYEYKIGALAQLRDEREYLRNLVKRCGLTPVT